MFEIFIIRLFDVQLLESLIWIFIEYTYKSLLISH